MVGWLFLCSLYSCIFPKVRNDSMSPLMIMQTLEKHTLNRVKVTKRKKCVMHITIAGVYYFVNFVFLG